MDLVNAVNLVVTDTRLSQDDPTMDAKDAIAFTRTESTLRDAYLAWDRPEDREMRDAYEAVLTAEQTEIDAAIDTARNRFPTLAA